MLFVIYRLFVASFGEVNTSVSSIADCSNISPPGFKYIDVPVYVPDRKIWTQFALCSTPNTGPCTMGHIRGGGISGGTVLYGGVENREPFGPDLVLYHPYTWKDLQPEETIECNNDDFGCDPTGSGTDWNYCYS